MGEMKEYQLSSTTLFTISSFSFSLVIKSLGWEDLLEKEMAAHSSTLAWKIPWTVEPGRLQSMGSQRVGQLSDFTFTFTFSL